MKKSGFTLIELIVVITILAILGTIAFISFKGFSGETRNAKITSDITNIHKGLSLYKVKNGIVPMPDNSKTVTAGATEITFEGEIGDRIRSIVKIDNNAKTPTGENYKYAVNGSKKEFTLVGEMEEVLANLSVSVSAEGIKTKIFKGDEVLTVFDASDNFVDADILDPTLTGVTVYQGEKLLEKTTSGYLPNSCLGVKNAGYGKTSGTYKISPNGSEIDVYCDMETDGGGWTLAIWTDGIAATTFIEQSSFSSGTAGINPNVIDMLSTETLIVSNDIYRSKYKYNNSTLRNGLVSSTVMDLSNTQINWVGTKLQFKITPTGIAGWHESVCPDNGSQGLPHQSTSGLYVYAMSYIGCSSNDGSMVSVSQKDGNNTSYKGWLRINNRAKTLDLTKTEYYIR